MERVKPYYLDLTSKPQINDYIEQKKWVEREPLQGNLDIDGVITIRTEPTDQYYLLDESKFIFDIDLTKDDGTRYVDADVVGLVNNAVMFMFESAKLEFGTQVIENNTDIGLASTCLGHLKYGSDFQHYTGLRQGWFFENMNTADLGKNSGFKHIHDELIKDNSTKGTYTFVVPFNHIFGFRGKTLIGMSSSVAFKRMVDNLPIYKADATATAKLSLKRMVWKIPYLTPSAFAEVELNTLIINETSIYYPFQLNTLHKFPVTQTKIFIWNITDLDTRDRPNMLILFFQTGNRNDQKKNPGLFDHCNLETAKVIMNNEEYPNLNLRCDFNDKSFMECYDRFVEARKRFTHTETNITPKQFKNLYPFFVFDLSNQPKRLTGSASQIKIECHFKQNVPADTMGYGLFVTDKIIKCKLLNNKSTKFVSFEEFT